MSVWRPHPQHPIRRTRIWAWFAQQAGKREYRLRPDLRESWGGPFNGQESRQRLAVELCDRVHFTAIVETGTHRGTTTAFLSRASSLPVHSFEEKPRLHGFARAQVASLPGVTLYCCDSRLGLLNLAAANALPEGPVLFYLDAHAAGESPILEELAVIFTHWPRAVVMIDDFAVPDDRGYRFDDYGAGRALTIEYLGANSVLPAGVWFPRCASDEETGERRGCVVLAGGHDEIARLDQVALLRRWRCDEIRAPAALRAETEG